MYGYRKLPPEERKELLRRRRLAGQPLHAPIRFPETQACCLITACCFEHRPILFNAQRREEFEQRLLSEIKEISEATIIAWVILPNHYHLLLDVHLGQLRKTLGKLHNGTSTEWNRADDKIGRRVWYRFRCDPINDEKHYYEAMHYIHKNPMKHRYAQRGIDWPWTSLHGWLKELGEDAMRDLWWKYPIREDYGKGWDD